MGFCNCFQNKKYDPVGICCVRMCGRVFVFMFCVGEGECEREAPRADGGRLLGEGELDVISRANE